LTVLKTKDICEALDLKRHQLRAWTDALAPYSKQTTHARSARRFDTGDLLFFATVQHIEKKFGLSISVFAKLSQCIYDTVRSPRTINDHERIFLDINSQRCFITDTLDDNAEGILIDIAPVKKLVSGFLGLTPTQEQMHFGLAKVS
jgi:hypothetical protein